MSTIDSIFIGHVQRGVCKSRIALLAVAMTIFILVAFSVQDGFAYSANSGLKQKNDSLAQVKSQVNKAQNDANAAAQRYSDAYSSLEKVSDQLADTQAQIDSTQNTISSLENKTSAYIKDAYIRSSESQSVKTYDEIVNETRRDQMLSMVSQVDDSQLTNLSSAKEDLNISRDALTRLHEDRKSTLSDLATQKKALDAKLAEASKSQKALEVKIAKDAKLAAQAKKAKSSRSSTSPGTIISVRGSLPCPVQGATAFSDDWGNSRSGGRRHKGTDIFAARGTPNIAVVDGTVMFQTGGLGGNAAFVTGGGYSYYYAHLDSIVGSNRTVKRGEIIGYTGSTGNAKGGAVHTHFAIHQGGPAGAFINPYDTLRKAC